MPNKHVDLFKDIIPSVDTGIKDLWDAVSDEGKKEIKGDLWNLNRFISCVQNGTREEKEHFLVTVNEYYNKNWNKINQHPKLQWLTLTACNFNKQSYRHTYIPIKKSKDKKTELLSELFPDMKMSDVETLSSITDAKEIKEYLKNSGWEDKKINELKL
jgi:hypothetical protein